MVTPPRIILSDGSVLNLTGTYIAGNSITDDNGGGIKVTSGTLTLTGATVTGNTVNGTNLNGGGAYIIGNSPVTFRSCTFAGNSCSYVGGGAYISGGSDVFEDCVFSGNVASNGTVSTAGGAMYIAQTTLTLSNCVFKNNFAYGYGGAIRCGNATTTIVGCVISSNSGGAPGLGIMVRNGTTILSNTVVTSNVRRTGAFDGFAQLYQSQGILSINGGCTLGNIGVNGQANGDVTAPDGSMCFSGSNFVSSAAVNSTGIVIISGGAIITLGTNIRAVTEGRVTVQTGGCTVNGHVIPAGSYTTINSDGTTT